MQKQSTIAIGFSEKYYFFELIKKAVLWPFKKPLTIKNYPDNVFIKNYDGKIIIKEVYFSWNKFCIKNNYKHFSVENVNLSQAKFENIKIMEREINSFIINEKKQVKKFILIPNKTKYQLFIKN